MDPDHFFHVELPRWLSGNLPAKQETWVRSLGWEDLREKEMATQSVFLPGESHGQSSLKGCNRVRHNLATKLK